VSDDEDEIYAPRLESRKNFDFAPLGYPPLRANILSGTFCPVHKPVDRLARLARQERLTDFFLDRVLAQPVGQHHLAAVLAPRLYSKRARCKHRG